MISLSSTLVDFTGFPSLFFDSFLLLVLNVCEGVCVGLCVSVWVCGGWGICADGYGVQKRVLDLPRAGVMGDRYLM